MSEYPSALPNLSEFKELTIKDISKVDDYLFVEFECGQKLLIDQERVYDISDYDSLSEVFLLDGRLCAALWKKHTLCAVDLDSKEVLLEDEKAYQISPIESRCLKVMMKIGGGEDKIYDTVRKAYLPSPLEYRFETTLGNELYVFKEKNLKPGSSFYDDRRMVIHTNGKVLLKDIQGWIEYYDHHLIIKKGNGLEVVTIHPDLTTTIQEYKQNDSIIAKPTYYQGNILILEKGKVKLYSLDSELIKEYSLKELTDVVDYELISPILKLCVPYVEKGKRVNRHLFLDLESGEFISHLRIEGYPYWSPTTFVGQDSLSDSIDYHFYRLENNHFLSPIQIKANSYQSLDATKECLFLLEVQEENQIKKKFLNTETGLVQDVDYDFIYFGPSLSYGYGVKLDREKMDFFDENLNILISDFPYSKFYLNVYPREFAYEIVGDYVIIQKYYSLEFDRGKHRVILYKADNTTILDSFSHRLYPIGDFIQIVHDRRSEFLNTVTGEIKPLSISVPLTNMKNGKIDIDKLNQPKLLFSANTPLFPVLETNGNPEENIKQKCKKL